MSYRSEEFIINQISGALRERLIYYHYTMSQGLIQITRLLELHTTLIRRVTLLIILMAEAILLDHLNNVIRLGNSRQNNIDPIKARFDSQADINAFDILKSK